MHWFKNWINLILHQSLVSYDYKVNCTMKALKTYSKNKKKNRIHNSVRYGTFRNCKHFSVISKHVFNEFEYLLIICEACTHKVACCRRLYIVGDFFSYVHILQRCCYCELQKQRRYIYQNTICLGELILL